MSTRKSLKIILSEHKTAVILAVVIIAGGSIGTYFAIDYITAQNPEKITLATTTSTYDSGLLDYLLPKFTEQTGIQIKVLSVGTGTAIQYGKDGNADLILVHSRSREDDFVNVEGVPYGIHRACIMFNDFIIVGHSSNPANLLPDDNITTVMAKLRDAMDTGNMTFYSRGDDAVSSMPGLSHPLGGIISEKASLPAGAKGNSRVLNRSAVKFEYWQLPAEV